MKRILTVLTIMVALLLAGCSGGDKEESTRNDLTLAMPADVVSLDPHGTNDTPSEQVRHLIYEGLVKQDENLDLQPSLATEWEQVDDLTWNFKLKEGVTFHDGSDMTAEDVKASFDRILDPAVASPRAYLLEMIDEIKIVSDYEVEITTRYPFSPFANNLTHGAGRIISKDLIDKDYQNAIDKTGTDVTLEDYYKEREAGGKKFEELASKIGGEVGTLLETEPSGTNYYQFDSRKPGEMTKLVRNESYHGDKVSIDSVTFKVVSETGARIAELESGQSQFAGSLQSSDRDRINGNEELVMSETTSASLAYLGFNTEVEPLNDKRVRQALAYAFDKEKIFNDVLNGSGTITNNYIKEGMIGETDDLKKYDYNLDKARELLAEAGYEDGFTIEFLSDDDSEVKDVGLYYQETLKELNIDLTIKQVEWGTFLEMASNGEQDMYYLGWSNATADPDNTFTPLFHTDSQGAGGNRMFYSDEKVDALILEGRQEKDPEKRQQIYEDIQDIIIEDMPMIPVRFSDKLNAYTNNLKGARIDVNDLLHLDKATLE